MASKNILIHIFIAPLYSYIRFYHIKPYTAGIDLRRQNLTSTDVRFWRRKSIVYNMNKNDRLWECLSYVHPPLAGWIYGAVITLTQQDNYWPRYGDQT